MTMNSNNTNNTTGFGAPAGRSNHDLHAADWIISGNTLTGNNTYSEASTTYSEWDSYSDSDSVRASTSSSTSSGLGGEELADFEDMCEDTFLTIPDVSAEEGIIETPAGDITLRHQLGKGSFGAVYLAEGEDGKEYAVKVMKKGTPSVGHQVREAVCHRIACNHPNIVTLHYALQDDRFVYLVLDYIPGSSLASLLDDIYDGKPDTFGLTTDSGIKHIFTQMLAAVAHCHDMGICHSDLQPQNILLRDDGEVFLADFGLATSHAYSSSVEGCWEYMSPETVQGRFACRRSSDIWSLGILLYELITNSRPWAKAEEGNTTFDTYTRDPRRVLKSTGKLSDDAIDILLRVLDVDDYTRMTLEELIEEIEDTTWFVRGSSEDMSAAYEALTGRAISPPTPESKGVGTKGFARPPKMETRAKAQREFSAELACQDQELEQVVTLPAMARPMPMQRTVALSVHTPVPVVVLPTMARPMPMQRTVALCRPKPATSLCAMARPTPMQRSVALCSVS